MKFCPTCSSRLRRLDGSLVCSKCEYAEADAAGPTGAADAIPLNVLAEGEGSEALPTIAVDCPKCGHGEAVWWMLQTRSADEPTTQFYRCTTCGHTWRDYS